jgi:hypothetical protein
VYSRARRCEFKQVEDETGRGVRWTVGNALEVLWDDSRFDELVALARDESYGKARRWWSWDLVTRRSRRPGVWLSSCLMISL